MYQPLTPGYRKSDAAMRWALPDRVFFACGACHVLAYAFLERWPDAGGRAVWIRPATGHIGNHIFIEGEREGPQPPARWAFDYHGYCERERFLAHVWRGARQRWPGWDASLVPLPVEVLISEARSRTYDGLWLREPGQFLHDALPRARRFLDRFPAP